MSDSGEKKESKVEGFKKASHHLRGTIAQQLADDSTHFEEADSQLLKFHGTYQQDNRDERRVLRAAGKEKSFQFMVRAAIPGGVMTAKQYLAFDELADLYGGGSLRITTRQGIQFHGVLKRDLKKHIATINDTLLTTLSACGDVGRNVMAFAAPLHDDAHTALRVLARKIAIELRPQSGAYHEIWLDGEKHLSTVDEEPFYGDQYLPRKFKTGITLSGENAVDVYSHDCGLVAFVEGGAITGFNVLVGGGMGMTHKKADTFAALAQPLGFIPPEYALETVRTVAAIFRDHGNRADRRHARLKYLLADWGIDRFIEAFRKRVSFMLEPFKTMPLFAYRDYAGPFDQGDGKWAYGLCIAAGRIIDRKEDRNKEEHLKSALRELVSRYAPGILLTPNQSMLLTDLPESAISEIETTLVSHGVTLPADKSSVRRYAMACVSLPTCGLALAEAERVMPEAVAALEVELASLGLRDAPLTLRITGCPNGCARPYSADIALVGRSPDVYHVFVGGRMAGDRMADLYAANVKFSEIVATLRPLLIAWSKNRKSEEGLGDFYQRHVGTHPPRQKVTGKESPTIERVQLGGAT